MNRTLERSVALSDVAVDDSGDGLTLDGHAAVFNSPTRINSWEGCFDETIAPGAFKKSISERTPVLMFEHGRSPLLGTIPIGAIASLAEDKTGLAVAARLHDNAAVAPVRDAIASGAMTGMSFRMHVVKDEWRDASGRLLTDPNEIEQRIAYPDPKNILTRTLREVKVLELGPVVFPAYAGTDVAVRDMVASIATDPQARADLARLIGTARTDDDLAGGSTTEQAAAATTGEPGDHSAANDDANRAAAASARHRALLLAGVINA